MAILYYTNASGDHNWETLTNWNTAEDGSGSNPTSIPWTNDGNGGAWYADIDLVDATGGNGISINSVIDPNRVVTGTCDIAGITNNGTIYGGTFSGDNFNNNNGSIYGGTFTGDNFINGGYIYGGTFTGDNFTNYASINGGTFTGDNFENGYGQIYGGTFTGNYFSNNGFIYGGTFTGSGFSNKNYGTMYGGTFISPAVTLSTLGNMTLLSMSGGPTFSYPTPASGSGGGGIDISRLIRLPPFIKI
jgi:hypothetical protein